MKSSKRAAALLLLVFLARNATPQAYLNGTQLPPTFAIPFANYIISGEVMKPSPAVDNQLFYLTTPDRVYMKSFFAQSALIPGAPPRFKDRQVWWYLVPDADYGGQYTARVYAPSLREYALVAVNLGPVHPDLVARFHHHLDIPPLPQPRPGSPLAVKSAPNGAKVEWFLTGGFNAGTHYHLPHADTQGYFAMLAAPVTGPDGKQYKPPFSLAGAGAGYTHHAYGQIVYDTGAFSLKPNLGPADFTPPNGYKPTQTNVPLPHGQALVRTNCSICHMVDASKPTVLFTPYVEEIYQPPAR